MDKIIKFIVKAIQYIRKKRIRFIILLVIIALMLSVIGELIINGFNFLDSVSKSIAIFALNPPDVNPITFIAYILATILVVAGFIRLLFKNVINEKLYDYFLKSDNIIVFGFGEINKVFLENLKESNDYKNQNVIVIDKEEKDFDEFYEAGYLFLKKEIDKEFIDSLNLKNTSNIIVSLGDDLLNIEVGLQLIDRLKEREKEIKLIVHVSREDINEIFFEKLEKLKTTDSEETGESPNTSKTNSENPKKLPVNLKTFSFYTEIVDDFFEKRILELIPYEYAKLNGDKKYLPIAIIGNSNLNIEIIKNIFINFIFPNETKIKLILIDENEEEFKRKVVFETNYTKSNYPHIELETKNLNYDLIKDRKFWLKDVVDIIIGFEDSNKNFNLAIDLFEKVFVYEDIDSPKIFFALFKNDYFSKFINCKEQLNKFKNFYAFANIKEVFNVENLLDDKKFEIAKEINFEYQKTSEHCEYRNNKEEAWYQCIKSNTDKLSSIAQAENVDIKLLSFGFKKSKEEKEKDVSDEYKEKIAKIEKQYLEKLNSNKELKEAIKEDNEFFEKFLNSGDFYTLCNTEHRRWMAFHHINNWKYSREKDKKYKKHNCLIDFKDFKGDIRSSFIYDFNAYKNIPNYLKTLKIIKI